LGTGSAQSWARAFRALAWLWLCRSAESGEGEGTGRSPLRRSATRAAPGSTSGRPPSPSPRLGAHGEQETPICVDPSPESTADSQTAGTHVALHHASRTEGAMT